MEIVVLPIKCTVVRIVRTGAGTGGRDTGLVAVFVVPDSRRREGTLYCWIVYTGAGVSSSSIACTRCVLVEFRCVELEI